VHLMIVPNPVGKSQKRRVGFWHQGVEGEERYGKNNGCRYTYDRYRNSLGRCARSSKNAVQRDADDDGGDDYGW
jgi:hypothetical protein